MTNKKYKIIIIVLVVIIVLMSIRIIFDSKFDDFSRFIQTRENYEGGTEKFDKDFDGLVKWEKEYKKAHPDATKEEINQVFNDMWKK